MKISALACVAISFVTGCVSTQNASGRHRGAFQEVVNGTVARGAHLDLQGLNAVTVPSNAIIEREETGGALKFVIAKNLDFFGFPPEPIDIESAQANLGIAYRLDNRSLMIATFGEWSSVEGGASITLTITAPAAVEITKATGLSGQESAALKRRNFDIDPDPSTAGFWYVAGEPADGWEEIADSPSGAR
jgi:hypothetical protein